MTTTIQAFDFSVNLLQTILWQYSTAPNLETLVNQKQNWYDINQTEFWNDWYADVFNLKTANDFGLQVWSIILNQPIYTSTPPASMTRPAFGFGPYRRNFTRGNFVSTTGTTYNLPTESARIVLQLRYFQLTSAGTVPEINRMLKYIFGHLGRAWLLDGLNMTQRYYFAFPLTSNLSYILQNFDVFPRPAGVGSSFYAGTPLRFGFGPHHTNFTRGNFGQNYFIGEV